MAIRNQLEWQIRTKEESSAIIEKPIRMQETDFYSNKEDRRSKNSKKKDLKKKEENVGNEIKKKNQHENRRKRAKKKTKNKNKRTAGRAVGGAGADQYAAGAAASVGQILFFSFETKNE